MNKKLSNNIFVYLLNTIYNINLYLNFLTKKITYEKLNNTNLIYLNNYNQVAITLISLSTFLSLIHKDFCYSIK